MAGNCGRVVEDLSIRFEDVWDLVRGEACGHCCTCRWWDMDDVPSVYADYQKRYDGICRIRSSPQPERAECDWCGEYEFFVDHE